VWTPRRVLLLLGGILLFCGVYGFYSRFLGWLDGKPQLPQAFLEREAGEAMPAVVRAISPTIERIRAAFGPDCLEQRSSVYPNQLEFKNANNGTSTVLACGAPTNTAPTRIVLAPFSVAQFSAPKPAHLREKDESPSEITTFHSDKAILDFDRPVSGPADMAKAKLLRMELVSEPATDERIRLDGRTGTIHITHNQRFLDPSKFLVVRTVGPLFYRDAKNLDPKQNTGGPDIWTDAAIEIVNRQNLPRRVPTGPDHYRTFARPGEVETAQVDSNILRSPAAVFDVLEGRRLPPPTATAIGLKVFLEPPPQPGAPPPKANNSGALGGVKRVELVEKVLLHLWSESSQGFVTSGDKKSSSPRPSPPDAGVAVLGGHFHAMETIRKLDRALLQVDTLGKLAYDTERGTARFDVLPDGNPDLPNDVQVHRVLPLVAGTQRLFSQILELEFGRFSPVGAEAGKGSPASTTVGFKKLRAWTETPNRFVTLSSESDRLEAYGQYLLHDKEKETTSLRGLPLYAARSNEPRADGKPAGTHILTGGSKEQAAILTLKPGPPPNRAVTATVDGPGRIELYDAGAQANTIHATWLTQMSVTQEVVTPRRTLDLFTFIDGAMFEDKKSDFWLKGKELRLWMEPKDEFQQVQGAAGTGRMQPNRVQALGNVTSRSADLEIEQADSLNVLFRDGVAPPLPPAPPVVKVAAKPPMSGPMVALPPPAPTEPAKPKPPMKLRARTVDTWMVRYPLLGAGPDANQKYDMDKAVCEGRVHVTQDSNDPGPGKTGLRVTGETLLVDHTPDGSVLTVSGLDDPHPGEVHHDGMSIIGAKVVLNQINNTADVAGRGSLVLPATSNLSGGELKQSVPVIVHWRDSMKFTGASRLAEFHGKVSARQNDSFVLCHIMQVRLDKPVDFSRRAPAGSKNDAKLESVRCYPAAEDQKDEQKDAYWVTFEDQSFDASGKLVKRQRLVARELEMTAKAFEAGGRDPHQRVVAAGPGTIRILQTGLKDEAGPAAAPKTNTGTPTTPPSDWKLTIVQFAGRMTGRDFGSIYQDATFTDAVDLMHVATDNIDAAPDRNRLPVGSVRLTCAERLIVSTHKKPTGIVQRLDGFGNVDIRSDQYDGWGESVSAEGPLVTLRGGDNTAASIRGRSDGNRTSGQVLTYNRVTGAFNTTGGTGGTFQSAPK
jgi:hypothetical protein